MKKEELARLLGNYVRAAEELHDFTLHCEPETIAAPAGYLKNQGVHIFATPHARESVLKMYDEGSYRKEFSPYEDGEVIYEHGTIGGVPVFMFWDEL